MDDLPKRDWLFPTILGTLLAGSVISFALAWTGHVVQHQELKMSADHLRAAPSAATPAADKLRGAGADVVVNGRTPAAVDRAIAALKNAASRAVIRGVAADLGTAQGCEALVKAEPRSDILVNNVGIFGPQDFFDIADAEWTRFFE